MGNPLYRWYNMNGGIWPPCTCVRRQFLGRLHPTGANPKTAYLLIIFYTHDSIAYVLWRLWLDGTKPLRESMLTYYHMCYVAFTFIHMHSQHSPHHPEANELIAIALKIHCISRNMNANWAKLRLSIYQHHWGFLYWHGEILPLLRCQRVDPHDDVIKWKPFPRYWLFARGIHRLPVNSPHKGQWRGALMFSLIYGWTNG